MTRIAVLLTLVLVAGLAAHAQTLPPQPPPVMGMGQGDARERAACHPDVIKHCQSQLKINPDDVLGILGCLQANRAKISGACQLVLASHGQ